MLTRVVYHAYESNRLDRANIDPGKHICTGCRWAMSHGDHYSCPLTEGYCERVPNGMEDPMPGVRTSTALKMHALRRKKG